MMTEILVPVHLPSGASDDLEDGEIFDDDEPVEVFKGGGAAEKSQVKFDSPPKELTFKNKSNSGGSDHKKSNKDKRSSSSDRRDKRNDHSSNRSSSGGASKRKRGRDSEDDHRAPNKNKQRKTGNNEKSKQKEQQIDEEIDENEMVYVMGGNSPTASSKPMDWDNNVFSDEEDQDRDRDNERGGRGRRGREGFHTAGRMSRRSRLARGGTAGGSNNNNNNNNNNKRNRFQNRKQNSDQEICKFYILGKCQRIRGNDCPYSHNAAPTKKMELCKFYMNDCCTKRDKCMYMHGDFPCKFYHTGQKCYAGKRCKFYHGKISNFLRSVLMKHLENRELQNEFEKYKEQYEKKERNRNKGDRFSDRKNSKSDEEGESGSTPMPSPQREETSDRERSPTPEREREKRERRRRRMLRRSRELQGEDKKSRGGCSGSDYPEESDNYYNDGHQDRDNDYEQWNENDQYYGSEDNYNENYNDNEYGNDDYEGQIEEKQEPNKMPPNLPKAQRKLFMRIQNQNQNKKHKDRRKEDVNRDDDYKEDNWYSSDEDSENNPLNTIFQNVPGLNMQQQPVPLMSQPIPPPLMQQPIMNPCPPMNQGPMNPGLMNQGPMNLGPINPGPMNPGPMSLMTSMMSQPPPPILQPPTTVPNVNVFDNIDLSAVTKILTTVRESLTQKKNNEPLGGSIGQGPPIGIPNGPFGNSPGPIATSVGPFGGPGGSVSAPINKPTEKPSNSPQHNAPSEERRFRDPRLRGQDSSSDKKSPVVSKPQLPSPILLTQADLDLRLSEPPPQQSSQDSDIDLRHLPFKPAPLHQAANEIDASIHSGPPLEYKLQLLKPFKPDYAAIASRSNPQSCANDPRLRKYATPQVLAQSQMVVAQALPTGGARMMSPPQGIQSPPQNQTSLKTEEVVVSRDPRNRGGVANDPRRRNQNLSSALPQPQQQPFGNTVPQPFGNIRLMAPQPFGNPPPFGEQSNQDNDFRLGFASQLPQQNPFSLPNMTDVDLRIQQPHFFQ